MNNIRSLGPNSYVVRDRSGPKRQEYINLHGGDRLIAYSDKPVKWLELFKLREVREQTLESKLVLEIGFGKGEALIDSALNRPDDFFIGIEVYPSGVASVLRAIDENALKNLVLVQHDAVEALQSMFEDEILDEAQILFPDPWPKKRHQKRRLLNKEFLELLRLKLKPGGLLHIATDWQDYAEMIMDNLRELEAEGKYRNKFADYAPGPQLGRPVTKFEEKARAAGRDTYEMLFIRV